MSMLRTAGSLSVAFVVGVAFAFAFLALTDPFASRAVEGLAGGSLFMVGCALGYFGSSRLLGRVAQLRPRAGTKVRTVSA